MNDAASKSNVRGLGKLLVVVAIAFAFTFALIPLYRIACEKLLGVRLERSAVDVSAAERGTVPAARIITVQFDGGVNSKLPWEFHPNAVSMQVEVGKQYETTYFARNLGDRAIVGSAVPSVAPARGSKYFGKVECFCFTAQTLQAGEKIDMPVRFIVDPALPADIKTLTLSYTFFKNDALTDQLPATPAVAGTRAAP